MRRFARYMKRELRSMGDILPKWPVWVGILIAAVFCWYVFCPMTQAEKKPWTAQELRRGVYGHEYR